MSLTVSDLIEDTFAGPGGWDEGLAMLGITERVVGYEWDRAACQTATAAGHVRVRIDVSTLHPVAPWGRISSPPCTKFSAAGSGVGVKVLHLLEAAIRAIFAGDADPYAVIEQAREDVYPTCLADREAANAKRASGKRWSAERVEKTSRLDAFATCLVLEPARLMVLAPSTWLAMEQVRQVQPLWDVYAECLRANGFHVWTGIVDAADYGVPQNRLRSILIAHRDRAVARPVATHSKVPSLMTVGWVSMAEALGWGFDDEPSCTISSGGTATGGAEPFANAGYRRRLARIVTNQNTARAAGGRYSRDVDRPSPTLTTNVRLWEFSDESQAAADRGQWAIKDGERTPVYVNGNQPNAARRSADEPAQTVLFGHRLNDVRWVFERPATTAVGSFRPDVIAAPGYRTDISRQNAPGSVRVDVWEAAVLQSFRADYPWQGSRTKRYEQVGNAVPPRLAAHVLAALGVGALPVEWEVAA